MKKIRHKIILMLMLIMIVTYFLADLMVRPLVAEFFTGMETWVGEMMRSALEITLTFIIFTGFIIIGVREITTPLMRLSTATQRIADGDYTVDLAPSRRKDEMGELERNFAVMVGELKSTEHMQKDFISNVSHEFKTPLSVITGYAKLLAADALTAQERRKYSGFVIEEATRLDHMTRNILLLSKLENAKIQPPREE